MSQTAGMRARDADREQVVDTLANAREQGQLSLEEYEQRTAKAEAAVTLGDLAPLTADLQGAPPPPKPRGLPPLATPKPTKQPRPESDPTYVSWRRALSGLAVLGVLFAVCLGVILVIAALTGPDGLGSEPELHEAAGFEDFVSDLEDEFGTTEVQEVVVYPGYAVVYLPVDDEPTHVETVYYDGSFGEPSPSGNRAEDDPLTDVSEVDGAVLATLVKQAPEALAVPDATSVYAIIEPWGDPSQTAFSIHANNEFSESGYLVAALDGHLLDAYPAGS